MGRERCEGECRPPEERLMRFAEACHAAAYGEEHPMSLGRVQRGRWRRMARALLRTHGILGWWEPALAAFYADGYWLAARHPFAAFAKQAGRYVREARRAEDAERARRLDAERFERAVREFGSGG